MMVRLQCDVYIHLACGTFYVDGRNELKFVFVTPDVLSVKWKVKKEE